MCGFLTSYMIDALLAGVKVVKTELIMADKEDNETRTYAQGKPGDVNDGKCFVAEDIPPGDGEVVPEHWQVIKDKLYMDRLPPYYFDLHPSVPQHLLLVQLLRIDLPAGSESFIAHPACVDPPAGKVIKHIFRPL